MPSQHAVSALALLGELAFACGDDGQAAVLCRAAVLLADADAMDIRVCAQAHCYAAVYARSPASTVLAPPPPPPPLFGELDVAPDEAVRGFGEALGYITAVITLGRLPPGSSVAGFRALAAIVHAAWLRISTAAGDAVALRAVEALLPPTYARDIMEAQLALLDGGAPRILAAARALATHVATLGGLVTYARLPLILSMRLLPHLRHAREDALARLFADAVNRSAVISPGLVQAAALGDA